MKRILFVMSCRFDYQDDTVQFKGIDEKFADGPSM